MYSHEAVRLISAHTRTIESDIVEGMKYELDIALPNDYENTTVRYPVVYMLDAYEIFGLQLQTYQQLIFFDTITPLILVGINYRFENKPFYEGLKDYLYIRSRDFTPTHLTTEEITRKHGKDIAEFVPTSGGGEKFLGFIREELLPFIESEYRVDTGDRGLLGYSLGGLFASYALFRDPSLFQRVFVGSPFLCWDDYAVFGFYDESRFRALADPVRVYLSVGELEDQRFLCSWERLKGLLGRGPKVSMIAEKLSGEYHLTGIGAAHSRAFWRLYGK